MTLLYEHHGEDDVCDAVADETGSVDDERQVTPFGRHELLRRLHEAVLRLADATQA